MLASPTLRPATLPRKSSMLTGCAKVARTTWPPMKSMPRFRPRVPTSTRLATEARIDRMRATLRHFMKSMLVLSGTSLRSFIFTFPLNIDRARTLGLDPQGHQHSREIHRGEDRGDDADQEHDRKSPDRAGAEIHHQCGGDRIGDVGVENGGRCFLVAGLKRVEHSPP